MKLNMPLILQFVNSGKQIINTNNIFDKLSCENISQIKALNECK